LRNVTLIGVSFFDVSLAAPEVRTRARRLSEYEWLGALPFILLHLAPLGALWTGTNWQDWAVCIALYWGRMFFVTSVYHRYFAHRTFKTSRLFQFLLAFAAMTSSQKGILWWASHHRAHHKYSDTELDPHNSRRGFWYSHLGWIFDHTEQTDYRRIRDFAKYPELVALNKLWALPPLMLAVVVWLLLGWSGLLIGFALSTAVLWHGTFTINSLSHIFGKQRYATGEDSKNNWLLAIITMGEGWHNNHHFWMTSTRQGFFWWEIDLSYYGLRLLAWTRLIWDIREPPRRVYEAERPAESLRPESLRPAEAPAAASTSIAPV
jgi:stearoyl-CoA desaturase (delta-9 desaturase)